MIRQLPHPADDAFQGMPTTRRQMRIERIFQLTEVMLLIREARSSLNELIGSGRREGAISRHLVRRVEQLGVDALAPR